MRHHGKAAVLSAQCYQFTATTYKHFIRTLIREWVKLQRGNGTNRRQRNISSFHDVGTLGRKRRSTAIDWFSGRRFEGLGFGVEDDCFIEREDAGQSEWGKAGMRGRKSHNYPSWCGPGRQKWGTCRNTLANPSCQRGVYNSQIL